MNTQQTPESYLRDTGRRLRGRTVATGVAIVVAVAIVVTLVSATLFLRTGYDASVVTTARLMLLGLLLVSALAAIWWPLRRLTRRRLVEFLERRNPALDGRLRTWSELDAAQPMAALLAMDTAGKCAERPGNELIPDWQLHATRGGAALCALVLLGTLLLSPDNWRFGAQYLWFGWLPGDRTPPQLIAVQPGDTTIKQGSNQVIRAVSQGFLPEQAILHAELDGEWQQATMQRTADGAFEFTLYGVVRPVDYYVSAVGVNSPGYTIDVIAMPNVENVRVDYSYPEWTGLEPASETPAARIRAVNGTEVQLTFETDRPMNRPELVINGEALPLDNSGTAASGSFTLLEDGEYFLVDYLGDEPIRISDTWPIIAVEDSRPTIQAVYPGRDWDATNIEEIPLQFEAGDDFGIQAVTLHYSVNGGEWQQRPLQLDDAGVSIEELLMLEELRAIETTTPSLFQPLGSAADTPVLATDETGDAEPKPLVPGDVISYYAEARDRELSAQTDILFIDVQPFERRFSQSQQAGGGAGGAGGGAGNDNQELAERQREIVVATWNLIRTENGQQTTSAPINVEDNSKMLGTLQSTLEEQTRTLADRARARQLDAGDPLIAEFVENLDLAAEAMMPAADLLTDVALNDSLQPQQKALQHLMRADALFRDISVSQQQPGGGGGGGGGGGAASDLAEIYELEMDLEKNQYETRDPIDMQDQPAEQALDDSLDLLDELARRQQQLADAAQRNSQMTAAERWQQEQLQRELEELQERLEQMQQQASANQSGEQGGAASAASQALQEAIESLNQANQQSQAGGDPQAMREAMEQAQQQLDRAREQLAQERQQQIGESFEQLAERAESLFDQQEQASSRLQDALRTSIAERELGVDRFSSGLSYEEEAELAEQKREMAQELAAIREEMERTAARAADAMPDSSDTLREARDALDEEDVIGQLNEAAMDIENGYAPYAAVREVLTTTALNNLRFQLQQAERLAQSETGRPGELAGDPGEPSAEERIRQLRLALEAGQAGGNAGDPAAAGGGTNRDGAGGGGGAAGPLLDRAPLDWTLPEGGLGVRPDAEAIQQLPSELLGLSGQLADAGIDPARLAELQTLARSLANQNPERLDSILSEEYERMIGLLEKMELALANESRQTAPATLGSERERLGDEDEVADYFRRLSEQ